MALDLVRNPRPDDPRVAEMRRKLDAFYATTDSYKAFSSEQDSQIGYHQLLIPILRERLQETGGRKLRVLELGAGRPMFPKHIGELRSQIEYHAQDVTPSNRDYLQGVADGVFISDIAQIEEGNYDLIFSTFVFEHVSAPAAFLEEVRRLLAVGGAHVIFCPRYDYPGYVCPSLRHLGSLGRLQSTLFLTLSRLASMLDRRARFWVNCDPAVFHRTWFRDSDAVHLVSRRDAEIWHRQSGFSVRRLYPKCSGLRDCLLKRGITMNLMCTKRKS